MTPTTYISTFKGNRFWPQEPRIDVIDIEDIAHGLAYQCRFNGQTRAFYSVAQHSLMVMALVPPAERFAALLHDAAEAYLHGSLHHPVPHRAAARSHSPPPPRRSQAGLHGRLFGPLPLSACQDD